MNNTNNISARSSYENARKMFWKALRDKFPDGPDGDNKCTKWVNSLILTQGAIRLEVQLNATNNVFTFGVTPNQSNTNNIVFNTERRLPLQDSICVTEMSMYVMRPIDSSGTPIVTGTNQMLRTYGNTQDFSAAAAQALDSVLYSHGDFTFKANNYVYVPYRPLRDFWYKPQTQQTGALGTGSPGDQIRGVEDAMVTCEPNLVYIGTANNIPQIELPTNLPAVDSFTRVVMIGSGPYAQNSTSVN